MKILITGAHFTPAVAVIEEFNKKKNIEVVYVGRRTTLEGDATKSIESQVLPKLGVKFIPIIAGRMQRSFTLYTITSLLKIPIGFIQAFFIILFEKPDVILAFGGYVSVPVVLAGWFFSIPIIIHEQTLVSGLANRISAFFADRIALSFSNKIYSRSKTILTGNPLRKEIVQLSHPRGVIRMHRLPLLLIMGGNQGSHIINLAVERSLDKLTKIVSVVHVTGDNEFKDFERLEKLRITKNLGERYNVKKWIGGEEWTSILTKVDLVVSRAGINTLMELAYLNIPALVIPIPYLYQDEQNKNAKFFEDLGLVKILPQSKLSSENLLINIKQCLNESFKIDVKKTKQAIILDAAKRLALETTLLVKE